MKILVFMVALQVMSTIVNVIHKLRLIDGPPAHVAIAILSMIVLFGYSGILNTLFLQKKFFMGRIIYMVVAMGSQLVILLLSIFAWVGVMTYFNAIAIIHGIVGFITIINFYCAVIVVDVQQKELQDEEDARNKAKLDKFNVFVHKITRESSNSQEEGE